MTETARLRGLLAEATPGPLEHREHDGQHAICGASLWVGEPEGMPATVGDMARVAADFALHVAAVNALPSLLDRLEAAEAVAAEVGDLLRFIDESPNETCPLCDVIPRDEGGSDHDPDCRTTRLIAALRRYDEVSRG